MRSKIGNAGVYFFGVVSLFIVLVLFSGCSSAVQPPTATAPPTIVPVPDNDRSWMEMPLTDLQGKGNFSIRSFAGRTVIILVVSDACPSCVSLLSWEIGEIEQISGVKDKSVAFVVLDIDPPVDQGFVAKYHDQFNFTGYTARSSQDMTLELLRGLGPFAVDSDTVPIILVCPDGREVLLPPGIKTVDALEKLRTKEC